MLDSSGPLVPADAFLPPGAKPFTDFGQYGPGVMDLRVFEQSTYWVTFEGRPVLLEDLAEAERREIIRLLLARANSLFSASLKRTATAMRADPTGKVAGLLPLARISDQLPGMDAYAWLEQTELMVRLRELTPSAPVLGDVILGTFYSAGAL